MPVKPEGPVFLLQLAMASNGARSNGANTWMGPDHTSHQISHMRQIKMRHKHCTRRATSGSPLALPVRI